MDEPDGRRQGGRTCEPEAALQDRDAGSTTRRARAEREAQALRSNLRRRKEQARARAAALDRQEGG